MTRLLFQVQPLDYTVHALIVLTLLVTGLMAAFVPARRATRVDPMQVLRHD